MVGKRRPRTYLSEAVSPCARSPPIAGEGRHLFLVVLCCIGVVGMSVKGKNHPRFGSGDTWELIWQLFEPWC